MSDLIDQYPAYTKSPINIRPAVALGTVSVESIRVLGIIPEESKGILVHGLDIFMSTNQPLAPNDYWIIELGVLFGGGDFEVRHAVAQPKGGFAKGRNPVEFARKVRYDVGEVVAVRARPIGGPASLAGCDVVLRVQEP